MNVSPRAVRRLPLAFTPGVFLSPALVSALTLTLALTLLPVVRGGDSFFQPGARSPRRGEIIYFLLPDRFNDGDPSNNTAGIQSDDPEETGFNPADPDFFHGGDLQGVTGKLDYLRDLGVTSIWMTPIFRNLTVQKYGGAHSKAGYHGYWILDFTDVDPHLGTKGDLQHLITDAKQHGIGILLDVVVNHTADIIQPKNGVHTYQYKFSKPYLDAKGKPFDDRDYVSRADFPALDPDISFPVPPTFMSEKDRTIKSPDWLNDPTVYHNRGEASTGGESAQYGDISGLDDLFTEQLRVVQGMIDIYTQWIKEFDVAGFRLDTVKHVNNEFWQRFVPAIEETAQNSGRKDFFVFGEVYDPDPAFLSEFVHRAAMPSVLDFAFQRSVRGFAAGADAPVKLAEFFAKDSYYTTPSVNAYRLVTFLGNHDIGRIGYFLGNDDAGAPDQEILARDILAHAILLFTRGIPAIYYGDEQGFTGKGGDAACREDMFGSKVTDFIQESRIGGGDGSAPAFNESHPLFRAIRAMISVRKQNPVLQDGIQIVRYADDKPGIFAVSRIDRERREEMLVVFNNSAEARKANIKVFSPAGNWERVFDSGAKGTSFGPGPDNQLTIEIAPWSTLVLRNPQPIEAGTEQVGELHLAANRNSEIDERWEIKAEPSSERVISVAFGVRAKGETAYKFLGTADSPPYRVFPTWDEVPNTRELEFRAVARDLFGQELTADFEWHSGLPKRAGP
ncbi:MAG: alpha amylase C-terminal domain-containing protein [Verrucomicrobia bacterium]|nr:alpha amylase C-terminal domain-containing protein [Verrucomicrobiota bacterium]